MGYCLKVLIAHGQQRHYKTGTHIIQYIVRHLANRRPNWRFSLLYVSVYGFLTPAFSACVLRHRFQVTNLLWIFRLGRLSTQSAGENSYHYAILKNGWKANGAMFLIISVYQFMQIHHVGFYPWIIRTYCFGDLLKTKWDIVVLFLSFVHIPCVRYRRNLHKALVKV